MPQACTMVATGVHLLRQVLAMVLIGLPLLARWHSVAFAQRLSSFFVARLIIVPTQSGRAPGQGQGAVAGRVGGNTCAGWE